jgi:hypothetical protein
VSAGTLAALATYERSVMPNPGYYDEWKLIYLARGGFVTADEKAAYLDSLAEVLKDQDGVLSERLYTEYARTVLAVTALGADATNVGGFDLTEALAHHDRVISQGINGPIFALIALDSGGYELPVIDDVENQASRERYLDYLLHAEIGYGSAEAGGFSLLGTGQPSTDLTAMALQALAPYYDTGVPELDDVVTRSLALLKAQLDPVTGVFVTEEPSPETIAQIIIAASALGLALDDERLVPEGVDLLALVLSYQVEVDAQTRAFCHIRGNAADPMASEQCGLALVSQARLEVGWASLYDMRDASTTLTASEILVPRVSEGDDSPADCRRAKLRSSA